MSYQTEDQQVEQLKEWWKDNGTPLIVGAVLGLSGFAGWKYWNEEQIIAQTNASDAFLTVAKAIETDDKSELTKSSLAVKTEYPTSSYAVLSAFQLAKQAVANGDLDEAASELQWVLTNHGDNDLAPTAKIRLARILVAQEQPEKALSYLNFSKESSYFEVASIVKGDALLALGKDTEALEAYQAANNIGKLTANHPTLKMKIASLKANDIDLEAVELDGSANDSSEVESSTSESESETENTPETKKGDSE